MNNELQWTDCPSDCSNGVENDISPHSIKSMGINRFYVIDHVECPDCKGKGYRPVMPLPEPPK